MQQHGEGLKVKNGLKWMENNNKTMGLLEVLFLMSMP